MTRLVTESKAQDGRGTRAAALVSRVLLNARAYALPLLNLPLTKSEEKVRRPAVYTGSASDWPCHVENSLQPRHYPDLGARHRYKFPVW